MIDGSPQARINTEDNNIIIVNVIVIVIVIIRNLFTVQANGDAI